MRCANQDCGENTIIGEMGENFAVVRRCNKCGAHWSPALESETPPTRIAQPQRPKAPPAKPVKFDVLKAARARLRELNAEIARLQKLTAERDQLARLLDAAKTHNGTKAAIPLRRCAT